MVTGGSTGGSVATGAGAVTAVLGALVATGAAAGVLDLAGTTAVFPLIVALLPAG
jgi:hypothetical protein